MILNDPLSKTATIPVRLKDGNFINYLTEEELCGIEDGAFCDLIVDAHRIYDHDLLALLNAETETELFPKGERLCALVNGEHIPGNLSQHSISSANVSLGASGSFVDIEL